LHQAAQFIGCGDPAPLLRPAKNNAIFLRFIAFYIYFKPTFIKFSFLWGYISINYCFFEPCGFIGEIWAPIR
jgi:hypothetical protein